MFAIVSIVRPNLENLTEPERTIPNGASPTECNAGSRKAEHEMETVKVRKSGKATCWKLTMKLV